MWEQDFVCFISSAMWERFVIHAASLCQHGQIINYNISLNLSTSFPIPKHPKSWLDSANFLHMTWHVSRDRNVAVARKRVFRAKTAQLKTRVSLNRSQSSFLLNKFSILLYVYGRISTWRMLRVDLNADSPCSGLAQLISINASLHINTSLYKITSDL